MHKNLFVELELEFLLGIYRVTTLTNFLEKPYGLNLLFILEKFENETADNGIEDTFESISILKPKKLAFVQYCNSLVDRGSIVLETSSNKKSKKIIRLSKLSKKGLVNFRKKFTIMSK